MWKLDFFVLPSNDYSAMCEEVVVQFGEKVEYLNRNENLYIPNELYDKKDKNGKTIMDFIYDSPQSDVTDYLSEIMSKQKVCSDTYEAISEQKEYGYLPMSKEDIAEEIEYLCVENIKEVEKEKELKVNDVIRLKRFYIRQSENYKIYEDRAKFCYPYLIFHDEAFTHVEELGKCVDVVDELTRHLVVLNDVGKQLYNYNGKNEKATLAGLKSGYNIECSGKGSNEEKSFNKEIIYNDKKFQLTCNPHTKLYKKRTDQRIYFCWGRDEIGNHSIIIVRIGGHWKE